MAGTAVDEVGSVGVMRETCCEGVTGVGERWGSRRTETAAKHLVLGISSRQRLRESCQRGPRWAAGSIGLTLRDANRAGENGLGSDQPEDANESQRVEGKALAEGLHKEAENMVPALTTNTKIKI